MASLINEMFMRFTRRAEVVDRVRLIETFVDAGPLMTLLQSRDHQVVYGRRGTGKTHALSYLVQQRLDSGEAAVYVDLRTVGSSGGIYSDPSLPLAERATRLLIDVFAALHDALQDYVLHEGFDLRMVGPALDRLGDSITEVTVVGTVEREVESNVEDEGRYETEASLDLSQSGPSAGARAGSMRRSALSDRLRLAESGIARHRVHFGRVGAALADVAQALERHIWVILDEWASVPFDLQPYLADMLRRTVLPTQGFTVKVGAIEQRSRLRLPTEEGDYVGVEIGADMAADVNLDDFMVFDNDPERAKSFFRELLFRHFRAVVDQQQDQQPDTAPQLVRRAFTQVTAFDEFIRSAEGVPRDAINIVGLAAQKALDDAISVEHVRTAARTWYQRDKEAAVEAHPEAHALLHWVIDRVIGERRARAFLLRSDYPIPLSIRFSTRVFCIFSRRASRRMISQEFGMTYISWTTGAMLTL